MTIVRATKKQLALKTGSPIGQPPERDHEAAGEARRPAPGNSDQVWRSGADCVDLTDDSAQVEDLSRGLSAQKIPVYNDIDDERIPANFEYISESAEVTQSQPTQMTKRVQGSCTCKPGSTCEIGCACARRSAIKVYGELKVFYECSSLCGCGRNCRQRLDKPPAIEIHKVAKKGFTVRLHHNQVVLKGQFVCEFAGEILTDKETRKRDPVDIGTYAMQINLGKDAKYCIDPTRYGNEARFISHSCYPNLHHVYYCGGKRRNPKRPSVGFRAARDIGPGEELTIDYGEQWWSSRNFRCECRHRFCKYLVPGKVRRSAEQKRHEQEVNSSSAAFYGRLVDEKRRTSTDGGT